MNAAHETDEELDPLLEPLSAEWFRIEARLHQLGRPTTLAGARAAARAARLNVNRNSDGSLMSPDLGDWLSQAVCASKPEAAPAG